MQRHPRTLITALALAAGVGLSSTVLAEGARIGALLPMTGALAEYGEASLNAIRLAESQINAQGGLLDGQLEVLVGDTQTSPQAGVAAAKQLVSANQVSGIVGALASGVTIPVAQSVSSISGVPQISSASTAPAITTLEDGDFLFRTTPHDAMQGLVLGDVVKEAGYNTVAVIYVNNDYGLGQNEAFSARFTELGGTVSAAIAYEEKQPSYRGELTQAAEGSPDALVLIAYPGDGIPIVRQALEEGLFEKFVMTDGMKSDELLSAIGGDFLNGTIGTAPEAVADRPSTAAFQAAYEERHGEPASKPYMDTAYDATFIMALAIQKAGSTDGAAVRDALREVASPPGEPILPGEWEKALGLLAEGQDIDYVGAAGSQDFDAAGDVPGTIGVWAITDGAIATQRIVEPNM